MQDFNLHMHTVDFDGKNTAAEMVDAAVENGMNTVGISNHFIVHQDVKQAPFYRFAVFGGYEKIYNDKFDDVVSLFRKHYDELERVAADKKVKILRGMEVDFFPSQKWMRGFDRAVQILKPDYLIGACHLIDFKGQICNIHSMKRADAETSDEMLMAYWRKVQEMAKSGIFTFLAHIDLPRRLNLGQDDKWADTEQETTDVIAKNKIPVEINTALYKRFGQPHPTGRIMEMCVGAGVPMFLSDDAHHITQVAEKFADAQKYAQDYGVKLIGLKNII